jgi:hypothetical protein
MSGASRIWFLHYRRAGRELSLGGPRVGGGAGQVDLTGTPSGVCAPMSWLVCIGSVPE